MKDSEILKELICVAWDLEGAMESKSELTLERAMDLYGRMLLQEAAERTPDPTANPPESHAEENDNCSPVEREREPAPAAAEDGLNIPKIQAKGPGASEKLAVHSRLAAFRQENGLGCFAALAAATNGAMTDDNIRDMYHGVPAPLNRWKLLGAALDYCERKEQK